MWKLQLSLDNGASITWIQTPYQTLNEALSYVERVHPQSIVINQRYEVSDRWNTAISL